MTRMLLDPDVPAFHRALLDSWSDEAPSAAARARAMSLASLAAGGALAGATGAAGAGAKAVSAKALSATSLALVKWLTIGTVVAGLAVGGASYVRRDEGVATSSPASVTTTRSTSAPVAAQQVATTLPTTPAPVPTTATTSVAATTPSSARTRDVQVPASTLNEQIAALDRARAAIAAGDGARGAQLVDDYERRFPRGAFVQEAEVLRIEARILRGDRAGASSAAKRFLAAHPSSPHGPRLRALIGTTEP